MTLGEKIDKCAIWLLIPVFFWLLLGKFTDVTYVKLIVTVTATLCVAGIADRFFVTEKAAETRDEKKVSFKELSGIVFTRKNARRFMFAALILFVFAFFIGFAVWYLIISGINVVLAAVCLAVSGRKRV